jgi:hypothetical protein
MARIACNCPGLWRETCQSRSAGEPRRWAVRHNHPTRPPFPNSTSPPDAAGFCLRQKLGSQNICSRRKQKRARVV